MNCKAQERAVETRPAPPLHHPSPRARPPITHLHSGQQQLCEPEASGLWLLRIRERETGNIAPPYSGGPRSRSPAAPPSQSPSILILVRTPGLRAAGHTIPISRMTASFITQTGLFLRAKGLLLISRGNSQWGQPRANLDIGSRGHPIPKSLCFPGPWPPPPPPPCLHQDPTGSPNPGPSPPPYLA